MITESKAEVQAESQGVAAKLIKEQGLTVLSIELKDEGGIPGIEEIQKPS